MDSRQDEFLGISNPKNAFIVGVISSLAVLGMFGSFVFGSMALGSGDGIKIGLEAGGGNSDSGGNEEVAPSPSPSQAPVAQPAADVPPVAADDHVRGNKNAPITIIEYSDFECPFCERFHPTMQKIVQDYDGKVKWVYRHFPLSFHPNAMPAAEAAECASEQGKFWEFADALFENQDRLGDDLYAELVGTLGLKKADFDACRASDKYISQISAELDAGSAAGINGTPGSFIIDANGNAQLISGALPYDSIKQAIDSVPSTATK